MQIDESRGIMEHYGTELFVFVLYILHTDLEEVLIGRIMTYLTWVTIKYLWHSMIKLEHLVVKKALSLMIERQ